MGIALAAAGAVLSAEHQSKPARSQAVVVADVSGRPTACLAADTEPATREDVARIWAAMHTGATGTAVNLQELVVPVTTSKQAQPYLAGLLAQHCDLVVTIGPRFGNAVLSKLATAPGTAFAAVDAGGLKSAGRLIAVNSSSAPTLVETNIRTLRRTAVG